MRSFALFTAAATTAIGLAATPLIADDHGEMHHRSHDDGHVPMYAQDLLAPYYAKLQ